MLTIEVQGSVLISHSHPDLTLMSWAQQNKQLHKPKLLYVLGGVFQPLKPEVDWKKSLMDGQCKV